MLARVNMQETMEWQRVNSAAINRLAKLGDRLAMRLIQAYRDLYDDKFNPLKQETWMQVCEDYAKRELFVSTRRILQDRWGHKIPSEYRLIRL